MSRIGVEVGGPEQLSKIGHTVLSGSVWRPRQLIMRTILNQRKLYRWVSNRGLRHLFPSLTARVEETAEGLRATIRQDDRLPVCEEYFWITKGALEAMPGFLGYPPAQVILERSGHTGVYHVTLPPKRRLREQAASFVRRLGLNRATAAIELERSLRLLEQKHHELQAAKRAVDELNRDLERRVEERTSELSHARDELLATVSQLHEAMAARDRLFADLNHEFRTPITLMLLPLERLLASPLLAEHRAQLLGIETNARKLLRLVGDLMDLAASREGRLRLRLERFDLAELAAESVAGYLPAAEQLGLRLAFDAAGPAPVQASREAVGRILDNLISNALKYTRSGGEIRVSASAQGDRVELTVADDGIGVGPSDRERIFERFERAGSPVHPGQSGVGVGLSLVKSLAEWHGGRVGLESEPGRGSRFWVELPAEAGAAVVARADRRGEARATPEQRRAGDGSRYRARATPAPRLAALPAAEIVPAAPEGPAATLLLVEDNPELREVLVLSLETQFRLLVARDGAEALARAAGQPVDLVVSDLMMPGMDGIELCRRFKQSAGRDLVPFLLLTANQDRAMLVRALESGADDFLLKPFNEPELIARVQAQLRVRELARRLAESERFAAMGRILAGMAHELRNPINVLVNGILPLREELASDGGPLGPVAEQLLGAIESASQRVNSLTEELLTFSRPSGGKRTRIAVPALVEQSIDLLRPRLGQIRIEKELAFEGEVEGSPHGLGQVLVNLVENALNAVGSQGSVGIATRLAEGAVQLDVWDDGPGVPDEVRARIFEPFFTTKPPGQGTGLGLAISRQIVERHGGRLDLTPSARGARFRVTLPPATAPAEDAPIPCAP